MDVNIDTDEGVPTPVQAPPASYNRTLTVLLVIVVLACEVSWIYGEHFTPKSPQLQTHLYGK